MDIRINKFREFAIKKWEEQNNGKVSLGNKYFKELVLIARTLRDDEELLKLEILLNDKDDCVLFETSAILIRINNAKAIEVIKELSLKRGNIAFCALITLEEWSNGNLSIDKL